MLRHLITSRARHHTDELVAQAVELLGSSPLTLLDVGAANGAPPRWQPFGRVLNYVAVEPDPRSSGAVIDSNSRDFVSKKVITKGLWHENGVVDLHLCRKPLTSSIYEPNHELLSTFPDAARFDVLDKELMSVTTVDTIATEYDMQFDAMKLDVQGAEFEVLRGAGTSLQNVLLVEAEVEFVPLYKGQPLVESVSNLLRTSGFELIDYLHLYRWHPNHLDGTGQLMFADALYMRSPESLVDELAAQRKMAALAIMYGRGDVLCRLSRVVTDPELFGLTTSVARWLTTHNSKSQSILQRISRLLRLRDGNVQSHLFQ